MTAPHPRLRPLPGLPMGALRWLLGKDAEFDGATGAVRHSSVCRWRHLVHRSGVEEWAEFQRAFWREHGPAVTQRHIARHPGTRPARWWQYSAPAPLRPGESGVRFCAGIDSCSRPM